MPGLRENAARLANGEEPDADQPTIPPADAPEQDALGEPEPLPEVNIPTPGEGGPENVPVHVAWSRVMETVRFADKDQEVTEGRRFKYRGIDAALNLFGPACRLHGVLVIPVKVVQEHRDTTTSTGKPTRESTVTVTYRIIGPEGDFIEAEAAGESLDNSDKGTAQAQSVALRTLLFHGALVPTRDPDPDSRVIERGEAPVRSPVSYLDEIANPRTSRARLLQIKHELTQTRQAGALVTNETGDSEPIVSMIDRIGLERFGG